MVDQASHLVPVIRDVSEFLFGARGVIVFAPLDADGLAITEGVALRAGILAEGALRTPGGVGFHGYPQHRAEFGNLPVALASLSVERGRLGSFLHAAMHGDMDLPMLCYVQAIGFSAEVEDFRQVIALNRMLDGWPMQTPPDVLVLGLKPAVRYVGKASPPALEWAQSLNALASGRDKQQW